MKKKNKKIIAGAAAAALVGGAAAALLASPKARKTIKKGAVKFGKKAVIGLKTAKGFGEKELRVVAKSAKKGYAAIKRTAPEQIKKAGIELKKGIAAAKSKLG